MPPAPASPSDEALVTRTLSGDATAFRALVERYEGQVAATVIGMLGPGADAEDVGQETFVRLYESLGRFRGDAALGTYLTRIAINQCLKHLRRKQSWMRRIVGESQLAAPLPDPPDPDAPDLADRDRDALVQRAVQALPAKHRSVVVLRMLRELSTNETAEVLGIPPGTVMSRLSRALASLRGPLAALAPPAS